VVRVLGERTTADELFAFAMPCALVSYLLATKVAQQTTHDFAAFVRLARTMGPLTVGVLVPIAVFLTPYLATHSVADLVEGTLIAPFRRVNITVAEPTEWERTCPAAILVGLLVLATHFRLSKTVQALIAGMGIYFVYRSGSADSVGLLRVLWHSMYDIVPWLLFAIVVWTMLTRPHKGPGSRIFVLLAFVACCNLSRFPYSARIYFCYIAPLVFLAAQSWLLQTPLRSRGVLIAVLAFFVIFNVMRLRPTFLEMGAYYAPDIYRVPFTIERASGIRTKAEGVATYEEIVKLVQEHSTGTVIYAGPDAPEVYFLTGKKNPTRDIFNFLNDSANADAMQALGRKDIDVVVWNRSPQFSHAPTLQLRQRIERDYPHLQQVGAFDVRWK